MSVELERALIKAAEEGNTNAVKDLLDQGVNIHSQGGFALVRAAYYGHTDTVEFLLDRGADIHVCNDRALNWAAYFGHTETVALLLERGADKSGVFNDQTVCMALNNHPETKALLEGTVPTLTTKNAFRRACREGIAATPEQAAELEKIIDELEDIKPKLDGLFKPRKPATKPG